MHPQRTGHYHCKHCGPNKVIPADQLEAHLLAEHKGTMGYPGSGFQALVDETFVQIKDDMSSPSRFGQPGDASSR